MNQKESVRRDKMLRVWEKKRGLDKKENADARDDRKNDG